MSDIAFTSTLAQEHRDELERLLFFNRNQSRVSNGVEFVAQRYGIPRVNVVGEGLRVELASQLATQTLFVVEHGPAGASPIGVVTYTRDEGTLLVLFVAVHEDYSSRGVRAGDMLLVQIVRELKSIARRVRGVSSLVLYVGREKPTHIVLRRG